ncbi:MULTISPECIES: hypothetical protein [unclassified Chryseobacterium]|uniref:hypothetical protein n=1 Tax=unclassified Chryseobacterium TaxID=2593645 RepID=UPI00301059EA
MRKIILLSFCFLFSFCSNQIKLNKGKEVDIIFPKKYISTQKTGEIIEEIIKNNTNNTYIIDPYAFYGESYMLENGNLLQPNMYIRNGYASRNDRLCRDILIILKPFQILHHSIALNTNNKAIYKYSKSNKYEEITKSLHNRNNVLALGCDDYIKELESKGYKVLEDSIIVTIPVKP